MKKLRCLMGRHSYEVVRSVAHLELAEGLLEQEGALPLDRINTPEDGTTFALLLDGMWLDDNGYEILHGDVLEVKVCADCGKTVDGIADESKQMLHLIRRHSPQFREVAL